MSPTQVQAKRHGAVLEITLYDPQTRNAVGPDLYPQVQAQLIDAGQDPAIRAVVLTGAGGYFSSGGNVATLKNSSRQTLAEVTRNTDYLNAMIRTVVACTKPVVAAVEGGAAGAGLSLALACDLIVAGRSAKFVAAYVRVGLSPDGGATYFLRQSLPRQMVNDMVMFGTPASADRLHAAGVVNRVTDDGSALDEAHILAAQLATGPSTALATIKRLVTDADKAELAAHLEDEARAINLARFGPEAAEGLTAFLEKRAPVFVSQDERDIS